MKKVKKNSTHVLACVSKHITAGMLFPVIVSLDTVSEYVFAIHLTILVKIYEHTKQPLIFFYFFLQGEMLFFSLS